jgi:hypothetical protein
MGAIDNFSEQASAANISTAGILTPDWSHEEYHANKSAVSCSVLKKMLRSPEHMIAYLETPNEETPSRLIGTSLHAAVLEPEKFEDTVVEWRDGDRTSAKYKQFVKDNPGKSILKSSELEDILGMRDAILNYKEFPLKELIESGVSEKSFVWTDPATGVLCKIRPDNINRAGMFDLKTTDDARPYAFVNNCVRQLYDVQAAQYTNGYRESTGEEEDFYFIAVETKRPWSVWVHQASPAMLAAGREKVARALEQYKRCRDNNEYSGYATPYSMIEWPKYA